MKLKDSHLLAKINPFNSVKKVYDVTDEKGLLLGIKDDHHIGLDFIKNLTSSNKYQIHTLDVMAFGGRAIDLRLLNPISGRFMSGSSSGTAINAFLNINDIGIGTDGGGSILAPAMSLNLFGFISYLIDENYMNQFVKLSTDKIEFRPSIGFVSSDYFKIKDLIYTCLDIKTKNLDRIVVSKNDSTKYPFKTQKIDFLDIYGSRQENIAFLLDTLKNVDFLISKEGPIDLDGFGDSVFGHFDSYTKEVQKKANKGLIRVVNMAKATAICIPDKSLACAYVGICESKLDKIGLMLEYMEKLVIPQDELIERYFRNIDTWNRRGFGE